MHLQRIQVPDFRALKDVDISFEKEFVPSIFPLGSLNGGGKSTLLQLIFVLLHCTNEAARMIFLKNMLKDLNIHGKSEKRLLAIIDIWNKKKTIQIEFFAHKDSYIQDLLNQKDKKRIINYNNIAFSLPTKLIQNKNRISSESRKIQKLERSIDQIDSILKLRDSKEQFYQFRTVTENLSELGLELNFSRTLLMDTSSFIDIRQEVVKELEASKFNLAKLHEKNKQLEIESQQVTEYLQSKKIIYICNYSAIGDKDEENVLLCQFNNIDIDKAEFFLKDVSQKVFLAAPTTQVFLFLSKEARNLLFREQGKKENGYSSNLKDAKSKLSGFFTYDFLAVDLLIESFKAARDRDFIKAIETNGEYGSSYKELIKDLNLILVNKRIIPNLDLSGVNFKLDRDGENIELQPEDLSHGELKRLSIYMWIKYHNMEDAIVLMDEVEIAFHPDWQYQIISDLQQWAPNNQYILATHSYELCQALTPSHVKELEPKLLKNQEA